MRRELASYLEQLGAPESVVEDVRVVGSEAPANVVLHADVERTPGIMAAEAWRDADDLVVRVYDEGRGLVPRLDSPGLGVGIPVMAGMVDDFSVAIVTARPGRSFRCGSRSPAEPTRPDPPPEDRRAARLRGETGTSRRRFGRWGRLRELVSDRIR